jgi:hypothetical protein
VLNAYFIGAFKGQPSGSQFGSDGNLLVLPEARRMCGAQRGLGATTSQGDAPRARPAGDFFVSGRTHVDGQDGSPERHHTDRGTFSTGRRNVGRLGQGPGRKLPVVAVLNSRAQGLVSLGSETGRSPSFGSRTILAVPWLGIPRCGNEAPQFAGGEVSQPMEQRSDAPKVRETQTSPNDIAAGGHPSPTQGFKSRGENRVVVPQARPSACILKPQLRVSVLPIEDPRPFLHDCLQKAMQKAFNLRSQVSLDLLCGVSQISK